MDAKLKTLTKKAEDEYLRRWDQGPTRLRWESLPLQVQDEAIDFEFPSSKGGTARLSDFWQERPALILFWRHFGCGCGLDRAAMLQEEYADFVSAGANVVIVAMADPERSARYAKKYRLPDVPILSDMEFKAYEAYGVLEGKTTQLLFDAPDEYLRGEHQACMNLMQTRREIDQHMVDNPWQLAGEFVVDPQGVIRLVHRYNHCEDYPNPLVLVAAIREAAGEFA